MKISIGWIRKLLRGAPLTGARAAEILTRAGLEVESVRQHGNFTGVKVAEVRGKRPHPDAQKLTLVDVFDGASVTQVVCGAPNVPEVGWRVLWAQPGAKLPMGEDGALVELGKKQVRGIESPGMLCAEDELGLGESHAGIITIAPTEAFTPGDDAAKALGLPDEILDLSVGANRPDCLGHIGVARELAAGLGIALPSFAGSGPTSSNTIEIEIADADACPRYQATVLEDITVGPSPLRTRLLLEALGVRAISNVVDATNLVMLEHSQPLHAFDLETLPGAKIRVRRARAGEQLETLDGVARTLTADDLLICDGDDRAIALAGVMGGKATEVTAKTRRVLLECAIFAPAVIRATAKRLGLPSEASHRFERGVDPNGVGNSAPSAVHLLAAAGGRVRAAQDAYVRKIEPVVVSLRGARTRTMTGIALPIARQAELLRSIGLDCTIDGDNLRATVPTFRPDLTREIDLIEEVLRLEGYDKAPASIPSLRSAPPELKHRLADRVRDLLTGLGLDEATTYAFVSPHDLSVFALAAPNDRPLRVANPLREEQSAMRTTLLVGLLRAASRNLARGVVDIRLFEIGHVFLPSSLPLPEERRHAAAVLIGRRDAWLKPGEPLDYFDLRGVVDELATGLGHALELKPSAASWLHPGVQGALYLTDTNGASVEVGQLGELHPRLAKHFDIETRALVFELDLAALPAVGARALAPIPRFPSMERDLSFLVDVKRSAAEINQAIAAAVAGEKEPLLVAHQPREDYRDPQHVPAGQKSMLWSFVYRASDRTLTDAEVRAAHDRLVSALSTQLALKPR